MNPATFKRPQDSLRSLAIRSLVALSTVLLATQAVAQSIPASCGTIAASNYDDCICTAMTPRWLARGSLLYMDRATDDSLVLMENTANPSEQLNTADFDFGWNVGFDVSLMRIAWDDDAIEIRYLDLGQLDSSTRTATNAAQLRINAEPPVFAPNVQSIDARATSKLFGVEANYRLATCYPVTLLAGIRYVSLDETCMAILDATPQTFTYSASTRNDLYGGQVGAITCPHPICFGWLYVSGFAKAGVYANDAAQHSLLSTTAADLAASDSVVSTAFAGECGVSAEIRISEHLAVYGGYSLLSLESVAIATEQIPATDFFNATGIDDRGGTIFHGAQLTIELRH